MKRIAAIYILIMCCLAVAAQTDRQHIRKGNRMYRMQKYDGAEVEYRKAVDKNSRNPQALYNLGCALMQQQKDSAAVAQLEAAGKLEKGKLRKSKIYHNIGVICQHHQMFGEAIEAYKESLRNNPNDDETRYNLALCQKQQKKQQQDNKDNNQDKDNKGQDQKKEQDNQDKKSDNQQKEDQQKPKEQMSKENAEQLLQAAMQEEKQTQEKLKQQLSQPQRRRLQNNW